MAVVGGSFLSSASAATTLTVCSVGCDHTTMSAAVTAAAPGDTVRVTEDLTVPAATTVNKDITVTGDPGVTITRTGSSPNVFSIGATGDGATISELTLTSATVVAGAFITVNGSAHDVTMSGTTIFGPTQAGPMDGWTTNRAWVSGAGTNLTVSDNVFHSLRTGGYIDNGSGTITNNVTYNTKGDYLLDEQADFTFTGNSAGDPTRPSEWGIVIFAVNNRPYDVQALGAANGCLKVWDQGTNEIYVDSDCDGVTDPNDAFPDDPNESADADGDGVGDNGDAFPDDPNESADADGDGVGDNADSDTKDDCKEGGFARFTNPTFSNQGQCVKFHEAKK